MTAAGLPYTCKHVWCNEQWFFSGDEQAVLIVLELNPENKTSRNKKSLEQSPRILPFFPEANSLFFTKVFPWENLQSSRVSPLWQLFPRNFFYLYNKFLPSFCKNYINYGVWLGYWSMSLNQCRTFATTINCSNFPLMDQASISQNSRRVFGPGRHFFSSIC